MKMSKAEEASLLESQVHQLKETLKNCDIIESNRIIREINYLKHEIELILERVREEETFFD